jgi:hypothetical protein
MTPLPAGRLRDAGFAALMDNKNVVRNQIRMVP